MIFQQLSFFIRPKETCRQALTVLQVLVSLGPRPVLSISERWVDALPWWSRSLSLTYLISLEDPRWQCPCDQSVWWSLNHTLAATRSVEPIANVPRALLCPCFRPCFSYRLFLPKLFFSKGCHPFSSPWFISPTSQLLWNPAWLLQSLVNFCNMELPLWELSLQYNNIVLILVVLSRWDSISN